MFPSVSTWFPSNSDHETTVDEADAIEAHDDSEYDGYTSDDEEPGVSSRIFDYIEGEACRKLSREAREEVEGLGYAAIVSSIGESMQM